MSSCSTLKHHCHTGLTLPLPWSASVPAHFSAVEAIPVALDKTSGLPYCYESIDIHNTYVQMTVFALREYNLALFTDTYVHTCACMCTHTRMYTHTCLCMHTHAEREREINTYQEICKYVYIRTAHTCIQYDVCMYVCTYVRTYVHTYMHMNTHLDISTALIFLSYSSSMPLKTFFNCQI